MSNVLIPPDSHEPFERAGVRRAAGPFPEHSLRFLQTECARLRGQIPVPRPWHYAELHNPWSRAGAAYDSWGFLDICQSSSLVETVAALIGTDIILFDSQWLPDRWRSLTVNRRSKAMPTDSQWIRRAG